MVTNEVVCQADVQEFDAICDGEALGSSVRGLAGEVRVVQRAFAAGATAWVGAAVLCVGGGLEAGKDVVVVEGERYREGQRDVGDPESIARAEAVVA